MREDAERGVHIAGVTEDTVTCYADAARVGLLTGSLCAKSP